MTLRSRSSLIPSAVRQGGKDAPASGGHTVPQSRQLPYTIDEIIAAKPRALALQGAVASICQSTGWDYAEIWIPDSASGLCHAHPCWFGDRQRYQAFRRHSEELAMVAPLPLVQRVAQQQSTPWYADVSVVPLTEYRRGQAARAAGLKATLAVPVTVSRETLAVVVFMTARVRAPDSRLTVSVAAATRRLADFFDPAIAAASPPSVQNAVGAARRCFGPRLERLSPREQDVLQLTLDGLTAAEMAARLGLSRRTVEVHRAGLLHKLEVASTLKLLAEILAASVDGHTGE